MKRLFLCMFSALAITLYASTPENYYSNVSGTGEAILDALYSKINSHTDLGYDGLLEAYRTTDKREDGMLWDMYSTCDFVIRGPKENHSYKAVCDGYNREHSVPQSWFNEKTPMKSDLFHVYPTDGYVNNQRSNLPYGECNGGTKAGANALGGKGTSTFSGYSGTVFEPIDEYKGDFARTYFYMVACYRKTNFTQSTNGSVAFTYSNSKANLTTYSINLFLKWHRQDPVSQKELDRNDNVYALQKNRNPFIDYPDLAEYIWGDKKGQALNISTLTNAYDANTPTEPTLTSPSRGSEISLGKVMVDKTGTQSFTVKGVLLENTIALKISGNNADYFTVSPSTVTAEQANKGQTVSVIYKPTETGTHNATLTLTSQDFTTVQLSLTGTAVEEEETPVVGNGDYVKVTENLSDWTGTYLIVYEDAPYCFDASLEDPDKQGNWQKVTITDNTIQSTAAVDKYAVTISGQAAGYTIRSISTGQYYGNESGNDIYAASNAIYTNAIEYSSGTALITCNNTVMRFNSGDGSGRFRYFKSTSWSNQKPIQLYRKKATATEAEAIAKDYTLLQDNGTLHITVPQAAQISIYDFMGRVVISEHQATHVETILPQGMYIIRINQHTDKILIR